HADLQMGKIPRIIAKRRVLQTPGRDKNNTAHFDLSPAGRRKTGVRRFRMNRALPCRLSGAGAAAWAARAFRDLLHVHPAVD
ncbi:hypothetical protein ACR6JC_24015, partial [Citrobacter europaeus]|uniref:hypothetical protein n=1 Tax=Citrobacter europaeus TaxID=1914243 RepID=UPI003ED96838